jgi:hypothetical protein
MSRGLMARDEQAQSIVDNVDTLNRYPDGKGTLWAIVVSEPDGES